MDTESDSRAYGYWHGGERRWPVRHHSGIGMERTCHPKWWKPHRPQRKNYIKAYYSSTGEWDWVDGWSSTRAHRFVVRVANRRYRHRCKQMIRTGYYHNFPYVSVDWVW